MKAVRKVDLHTPLIPVLLTFDSEQVGGGEEAKGRSSAFVVDRTQVRGQS